jgi:hypothetical protein
LYQAALIASNKDQHVMAYLNSSGKRKRERDQDQDEDQAGGQAADYRVDPHEETGAF